MSGRLLRITTFTASGTWNKPIDVSRVLVRLVGGGGNSANATYGGGGGGGGGGAEKFIDVTAISSVTVTVGGATGTSSFGTHCSATGGTSASGYTPGIGGTGSNGDINISGKAGLVGPWEAQDCPGGCSGFIKGNARKNATNTYLAPAANSGNGASGTSVAGNNTGASGIVIIYEYS